MRDKYYGDKRDLVKWGVLLQLATLFHIRKSLQVAYFRPSQWGDLDIDGMFYELPQPVIEHFRNFRNITKLTTNPKIQVVSSTFSSNRRVYAREVLRVLGKPSNERRIVFLDPDTGLESQTPNLQHVLDSEVAEIWGKMGSGEVLVLYQHQTNYGGKPWIEPKRKQFEDAIGLAPGTAKVAKASKIAPDVAFFYAEKGPLKQDTAA